MKKLQFKLGGDSSRIAANGQIEDYAVEHYAQDGDISIIVYQNICGATRMYQVHFMSEMGGQEGQEFLSHSDEIETEGSLEYSQEGLNQLVSDAIGGMFNGLSRYYEQCKVICETAV